MRWFTWILTASLLGAPAAWASDNQWKLARHPRTGNAVARLTSPEGKVVKQLDVASSRYYVPVNSDDVKDRKLKTRAKKFGLPFLRLIAKDLASTVLKNGRLLVVQEQTIVMPPYPDDPQDAHASEFKAWAVQNPEEDYMWVTLYDESGRSIWSRKYGPLTGAFPNDRKRWEESSAAELAPGLPDDRKGLKDAPAPVIDPIRP